MALERYPFLLIRLVYLFGSWSSKYDPKERRQRTRAMNAEMPISDAVARGSASFTQLRNSRPQSLTTSDEAKEIGWMSANLENGPKMRSENDLLACVADRQDRGAFALLFNRLAPRVKSYMMKLGAAPDVAEEIAQEIFVTVWRKAIQFDAKKASATTWIFTIARNLRIDRLRKEKRPALDPNEPLLHPDNEPTPLQVVEQAAITEQVTQSIDALPPEQQQVIRLSFVDGLSHQEISAQLDLPLGTVKSRLRLSFEKLRLYLGDIR